MDATNPDTTNALIRIADTVITILSPILMIMVGWLVRKIWGWFGAKTDEKQLATLDDLALKGVHYAEELGRKAAKIAGEKLPRSDKLDAAVDFVMTAIEKHGWHTWTRDKVVKLVEAKLHIERSGPAITTTATVQSKGGTLPPPIAGAPGV